MSELDSFYEDNKTRGEKGQVELTQWGFAVL